MQKLTPSQRAIVSELADALSRIDGIEAVALGGSYARDRARADSDIDIGIYYFDRTPFEVSQVQRVAAAVHDDPDPVTTEIGQWGPWANGGAWLTIGGQRVDILYRSLDRIDHVIVEAERGDYELHYGQQPPFGFFGPTVLGEVSIAIPLIDPNGRLDRLKARVATYPEALRAAVVQHGLWAVDFGLSAFAPKFAQLGDSYGTAGCLARFAHQLVLVLFAFNRVYLLNDKTALAEVEEFRDAPAGFADRIRTVLSRPGDSVESLQRSVQRMQQIFDETVALVGNLYRPDRKP